MSEPTSPPVVELVDAGVPADQGLSSLGMLLQAAGNVFAALGAVVAFYVLALGREIPGGASVMLFALLGIGVVRSLCQNYAGSQLLYGEGGGGRLGGLRRYIQLGVGHSLAFGAFLAWKLGAPASAAFAVTLGLAAWPVTLAIVFSLPRFRRFRDELPISEDKGFEGAAILMTVLGLCGLFASVGIFLLLVDLPSAVLTHGPTVLIVLAVAMLVARSAMHVRAGLAGLRETSIDRSVELVNRYANFGIIAAFCCGGALLLMMMMQSINILSLALLCALVWMLMTWPVIVRRFFAERHFADLLAGSEAPVHRRAPDAGATALGWLLFAYAVYSLSFAIPGLVIPNMRDDASSSAMRAMMALTSASSGGHFALWSFGLIALQGWAGFELVCASRRARIVATAYGAVSAAFSLYVQWPLLQELRHAGELSSSLAILPLALSLVLPIATILLVNRQIAPSMRARFRTPPA